MLNKIKKIYQSVSEKPGNFMFPSTGTHLFQDGRPGKLPPIFPKFPAKSPLTLAQPVLVLFSFVMGPPKKWPVKFTWFIFYTLFNVPSIIDISIGRWKP